MGGARGSDGAEEEGPVGGVQEHRHHVASDQAAEEALRARELAEAGEPCPPARPGPDSRNGTGSPEWITSGTVGVAWSPVTQITASGNRAASPARRGRRPRWRAA